MRIVVLVKPVPDPASAGERLGPDGRLDRAAVPAVVNGNDEYVLEAALKLDRGGRRGRDHAPRRWPRPTPPRRCARRSRWAPPRRPRDRSRAGRLVRRLDREGPGRGAAASSSSTWSSPASTRPTASVASSRPRSPRISACRTCPTPRRIEPDMAARHRPCPAHQRDRLRRARGATPRGHRWHAGARRAALPVAQGDHGRPRARRSSRRSLADLGARCGVGRGRGRDDRRPRQHERRRPAAATEVVRGPADEAPPGSSTSWPSGGSSDGRAVGRRRARARRRPRQDQRRGGDARPRAGCGRRPGRRRDRRGGRSGCGGRRSSPRTCRVVWPITDPAAADHAWSAVAAGHIAALADEREPPDVDLRRGRRRRS